MVAACATLLLAGCSPTPPPDLVPRTVPATAPVDPAAPCSREAPAAAPADRPAPAGTKATFDRAANKIVLSAGDGVTLPALSRIVDDPAALRETAPGEWLLAADLEISGSGSLQVTATDVRWLKLQTGAGRFASVRALGGGKLDVNGTCVTSWDPAAQKAATDFTQPRSFLLARDGGRMTIEKAELRFLGYGDVESYGLSWRTAGTTGSLTDSIVSNLYYGMYSYEVDGLVVTGNEIYNSVVYGVDPHTGSHNLKIERNVVHDNGKHGIILAEDCVDSVIRGNIVYGNQQHGIVLYLRSNRNVVEQNEIFRNVAQGINVNESSDNIVRTNRVYENEADGISVTQSSTANTVEQNDIRGNKQDGVRLVSLADQTTVRDNIIGENIRYGLYIDVEKPFTITANTIFKSKTGVLLTGTSTVSTSDNTMFDNTKGDVRNN